MLKVYSFFNLIFIFILASSQAWASNDVPAKTDADDALIRDLAVCLSLRGFPVSRLEEIPGLTSGDDPPLAGIDKTETRHFSNENISITAVVKNGVISDFSCIPRRIINTDRLLKTNIYSAAGFRLKCTSTFREYKPFFRYATFGLWRGPKIATVSFDSDDFLKGMTSAIGKLSEIDRKRFIMIGNNAEVDTQCVPVDRNLASVPGPIMKFSAQVK
jgi:hypothetical protein